MTRITRLLNPARPRPILGSLLPALLAASLLSPLMASSAPPQEPRPAATILRPAGLVAQLDALAAQEGIDPHLLRAIAEVESQFDPKAVSRNGSTGLLQVMPGTARKYGAQDLQDPAQVMAAGARYLKHLLERYNGDASKAVAAYNGGEEAVDAGNLSEETRRYAPAVLKLAQSRAVQPEPASSSQAAPALEKKAMQVAKDDPTAPCHVRLASHDGLLTLDLTVTRQELVALLRENWNWLFAVGGEDRKLERTLPPIPSGGHDTIKIDLKGATPEKVLQNLARTGHLPEPLSEAWLKQLPPGTVSGELKPLAGGEWDVRMQVLALDGFEVEFRSEGQAKPIARILSGDKSGQRGFLRTRSMPHIRMESIQAKRMIVRATERGTGRWGEAIVDLASASPSFRLSMDKERTNP